MSDKSTLFPASKLGEYIVTGDIAEGTFGKVKSTFLVGDDRPLVPG